MLSSRQKDLTGMTFSSWTVIQFDGIHEMKSAKTTRWLCRCVCGTEKICLGSTLSAGLTINCGCLRGTHGHTKAAKNNGKASTTYSTWKNMLARCCNPKSKNYEHYHGNGITVCDRWRYGENGISAFECFLADMGEKPTPAHSIDREDNKRGYHKDNCRWATKTEQANNRSTNLLFEYRGKTYTVAQLGRLSGLGKEVIRSRLVRNISPWTVEAAVETPICEDRHLRRGFRKSLGHT
jgi:hypothetical protein